MTLRVYTCESELCYAIAIVTLLITLLSYGYKVCITFSTMVQRKTCECIYRSSTNGNEQ